MPQQQQPQQQAPQLQYGSPNVYPGHQRLPSFNNNSTTPSSPSPLSPMGQVQVTQPSPHLQQQQQQVYHTSPHSRHQQPQQQGPMQSFVAPTASSPNAVKMGLSGPGKPVTLGPSGPLSSPGGLGSTSSINPNGGAGMGVGVGVGVGIPSPISTIAAFSNAGGGSGMAPSQIMSPTIASSPTGFISTSALLKRAKENQAAAATSPVSPTNLGTPSAPLVSPSTANFQLQQQQHPSQTPTNPHN
ncbi:MAG: hypothetical protein J3Q66DRAFT_343806 [Benniella sp.]|nr:MAG: hypothetical protein J3Q66DRAFT_343806 [Benniella sp.]